jgi:hypothetical protein
MPWRPFISLGTPEILTMLSIDAEVTLSTPRCAGMM